MNLLPIHKIFLAGFAFALTHWQKILQISIFPVLIAMPFLLIVPELLVSMEQIFNGGQLIDVHLPDNVIIYSLLFFYGYIVLSINLYRLVLLGTDSVSGLMPILAVNKIAKFAGLTLLIALVTTIPVVVTQMPFLQLVVYFLIIPITLNFVNIAIDQPAKYRWNLSFISQINLFFLQVVLPSLVTILFSILSNEIGLGSILNWIIKILLFYWTLTTLALCHQLIMAKK